MAMDSQQQQQQAVLSLLIPGLDYHCNGDEDGDEKCDTPRPMVQTALAALVAGGRVLLRTLYVIFDHEKKNDTGNELSGVMVSAQEAEQFLVSSRSELLGDSDSAASSSDSLALYHYVYSCVRKLRSSLASSNRCALDVLLDSWKDTVLDYPVDLDDLVALDLLAPSTARNFGFRLVQKSGVLVAAEHKYFRTRVCGPSKTKFWLSFRVALALLMNSKNAKSRRVLPDFWRRWDSAHIAPVTRSTLRADRQKKPRAATRNAFFS